MAIEVGTEPEITSPCCQWCRASITDKDVICGNCSAAIPNRKARALQTRCSYCSAIYPRTFAACPFCNDRPATSEDTGELRPCASCNNLVAQGQVCPACKSLPQEEALPPSPYLSVARRRPLVPELWSSTIDSDVSIGAFAVVSSFVLVVWLAGTYGPSREACVFYLVLLIAGSRHVCRKTRNAYPYLAVGMTKAWWICTIVLLLLMAIARWAMNDKSSFC